MQWRAQGQGRWRGEPWCFKWRGIEILHSGLAFIRPSWRKTRLGVRHDRRPFGAATLCQDQVSTQNASSCLHSLLCKNAAVTANRGNFPTEYATAKLRSIRSAKVLLVALEMGVGLLVIEHLHSLSAHSACRLATLGPTDHRRALVTVRLAVKQVVKPCLDWLRTRPFSYATARNQSF